MLFACPSLAAGALDLKLRILERQEHQKKSHKEDQAGKVKNAPAWMEDKLTWELYKKFLGEQLENLKEEELMEDALKDVVIDDKSKKKSTSKTFTSSKSMSGDVEEDDFYTYEEFENQKSDDKKNDN